MIDHFEIKTIEFKSCVEFYSKVLGPLNIENKWSDDSAAGFGVVGDPRVRFLIEKSDNRTASHIAFSAHAEAAVNQFHSIGLDNGYINNGKPGIREH